MNQFDKQKRANLLRAINTAWRRLRPDLRHSAEDLREARLDYASATLGIGAIGSYSELTAHQMGRVLDAMNAEIREPKLLEIRSQKSEVRSQTGSGSGLTSDLRPLTSGPDLRPLTSGPDLRPLTSGPDLRPLTSGSVIHLASQQQQWAIAKLLDWLGWKEEARERFVRERFRRWPVAMLSPKQANRLMTILLTIAGGRLLKREHGENLHYTRPQVRRRAEQLKRELGIGQKSEVRSQRSA